MTEVRIVARLALSSSRALALGLLAAGISLPADGLRSQVPATAAAQPQDPQSAKPRMAVDDATDTIAFSMGEHKGMELVDFIKWGQAVTGKRFTYNPKELLRTDAADNTVSLLGTIRLERKRFVEDFYSFFQTMLYIKGFAIVPRGEGDHEVLEIVKAVAGAGSKQPPRDQPPRDQPPRDPGAKPSIPKPSIPKPSIQKPSMGADENAGTISFSMGENEGMELVEFVKWAQEVTGKRFTYSRKELQGTGGDNTVSFLGTFRFARERFAEDFFAFFQTILYTKGFAVVPRGEGALELHEIVKAVAGAEKGKQPQSSQGASKKMGVDEAAGTIAFSMDEGEGMELIDFVQWGQEVTGKRFTFSRKELQQAGGPDKTIKLPGTFRLERKRFAEDFFVFFQTILYTKGFAVVRRGEGALELHEIVKMARSYIR